MFISSLVFYLPASSVVPATTAPAVARGKPTPRPSPRPSPSPGRLLGGGGGGGLWAAPWAGEEKRTVSRNATARNTCNKNDFYNLKKCFERVASMRTGYGGSAHWAYRCEDMEMGLTEWLWMNVAWKCIVLYKRKINAKSGIRPPNLQQVLFTVGLKLIFLFLHWRRNFRKRPFPRFWENFSPICKTNGFFW